MKTRWRIWAATVMVLIASTFWIPVWPYKEGDLTLGLILLFLPFELDDMVQGGSESIRLLIPAAYVAAGWILHLPVVVLLQKLRANTPGSRQL